MIKLDSSRIVYLYDFYQGGYIHKFPNIDEVIKFIASQSLYNIQNNKWESEYISNLNMGKDILIEYSYFSSFDNPIIHQRRFLFIDEKDKIIDVRLYYSEIVKCCETENIDFICLWFKRKQKRYNRWNYKEDYSVVKYRIDPIPYTGKKEAYKNFKSPKCFSEIKQNSDLEIQPFIRAKRNVHSLYFNWYNNDRRSRYRSKSWKDCTKKRKQWM